MITLVLALAPTFPNDGVSAGTAELVSAPTTAASTTPALIEPVKIEPAAIGPASAAPAAFEDKPSMEYTYVEANYIWTDIDDVDESVDGVELTGSLELPLNFFAQLTYVHQEDQSTIDYYRIGAGYHLPLGATFDFYGILSFAHIEFDDSGADFNDDGVQGEVGGRFLLTPKLELDGFAKWVDVHNDDFGVGVGARFYIIDRLSLGARAETLGDDTTFAAGARFEL